MLAFFLFVIWIWILIAIFSDIFRSDDMGGWAKALWSIFVIFLPYLGVLRVPDRSWRGRSEHLIKRRGNRSTLMSRSGRSLFTRAPPDDWLRLAELNLKVILTDSEFAAQKAKILGNRPVVSVRNTADSLPQRLPATRSAGCQVSRQPNPDRSASAIDEVGCSDVLEPESD